MNDKVFFELLKTFVFEVSPIAKEALNKRVYYPPTYDKYPRVTFNDNNVPSLDFFGDKPKDISAVFTCYSRNPDVDLEAYNSYKECVAYISKYEYFKKVIIFYDPKEDDTDLFRVKSFLIDIIERYYLLNTDCTPNEELLESIYRPLEYAACNDKLYMDISVPLLNVTFDFEKYEINSNCFIRKISDEAHKSRLYINKDTIPNSVISSSTHELVLTNWYYENDKGNTSLLFSIKEGAFPSYIFNNIITALKICCDINSGYSQILIYPKGWAYRFEMDLSTVYGIAIKKYPVSFERNNTINNPTRLGITEVKEIGRIFTLLQECNQSKIDIACKRLRYSFMRDDEEDSILDLIIAIEVLLTDNDTGEIIYKLRMRLAKLISMYHPEHNSSTVLDKMKKAYTYRSKIVHGSNNTNKNTSQKMTDTKGVIEYSEHTINAATYLRLLIKTLLNNPQYLDVTKIDGKMIE